MWHKITSTPVYNHKHQSWWCYLARKWHTGEMKPLSNTDDSLHAPSVNEVTHYISSDHFDAQCTQLDSYPLTSCKIHSNTWPIPETSVLMPSNLQIHRQVQLSNANISKETKINLYKLLQKYDAILSKSNNDIGQTDLIEMYIATRQDAAPVAAWSNSLALKHHDFLKQEIKNLLYAGIICKSMSPWASAIVVVIKHTLRFATAVSPVYWL